MCTRIHRGRKYNPLGAFVSRQKINFWIAIAFPCEPPKSNGGGRDQGECCPKCLQRHKPGFSRDGKKCVPGGIRTPNLPIRSQMLYPVELQTQNYKSQVSNHKAQNLEPGT